MKRTPSSNFDPLWRVSRPGRRGPALALALCLASGAAGAQATTFTARLEGSQAVPPVVTAASGEATVAVDLATGDAVVDGSYASLSSPLLAAVLHGPGTSIAGLAFSGSQTGTFHQDVTLDATQRQQLLDGELYVDLHTGMFGAGELRGYFLHVAGVGLRNAGPNPASYAASAPVLGETWTATVDLATTGHALAQLIGFDSTADVTLGAGQRLLCLDLGGSGELLGIPAAPGPLASFSVAVPFEPSLSGRVIPTQAVHLGGVMPFALSNAQDLSFGL